MKKQLLIAAVAATMTSVAFADISISGSANLKMGSADGLHSLDSGNMTGITDGNSKEYSSANMDIDVVGTNGATSVNAHIDVDDASSTTGTQVIDIDKLWMETDIGAVHVKGGDYASCVGMVEAIRACGTTDNTITLSTKLADWTVGFTSGMGGDTDATGSTSKANAYTASGKIGNTAVKLKHVEDTYSNVAINADLSGVNLYVEYMKGDDEYSADAATEDANTLVAAISGKAGGVTLKAAILDADDAGAYGNNGDMRLLGSSLIGDYHTAAYDGTFAMADVWALGANFDVAGNNINIVFGKADTVAGYRDNLDFADVVLQRKLAGGTTLDLSYGKADDVTSTGNTDNYGAKLNVKF